MTDYGKIKSYDTGTGAGMITPEKGGDALPFNKSDLQQQAQEPRADQRYGYETSQGAGGKPQATNLQMEQGDSGSSQQGESNNRSGQQSQSENRSGQQGESQSRQNQQGQQGQKQKGQNDRNSGPQG